MALTSSILCQKRKKNSVITFPRQPGRNKSAIWIWFSPTTAKASNTRLITALPSQLSSPSQSAIVRLSRSHLEATAVVEVKQPNNNFSLRLRPRLNKSNSHRHPRTKTVTTRGSWSTTTRIWCQTILSCRSFAKANCLKTTTYSKT